MRPRTKSAKTSPAWWADASSVAALFASMKRSNQQRGVLDTFSAVPASRTREIEKIFTEVRSVLCARASIALVCRRCAFFIFWFLMVSDLVSPPIWFHWLRHTADRARGSVAHADAPLSHEHATAFAFGEHISTL